MQAKFDSPCPGCGNQIRKGDDIFPSPLPQHKNNNKKKFVCLACWRGTSGASQASVSGTGGSAPDRNCLECPSFLNAAEARSFFHVSSIDFPMCATYGKVLGRSDLPAASVRHLGKKAAASCPSFGNARPKKGPEFLQSSVTSPRTDAIIDGVPTAAEQAQVTSCLRCKFFISSDATVDAFLWPNALCAKTGRLLIHETTEGFTREADNCNLKKPGSRKGVGDMKIAPIFIEAGEYDPDPVKAFLARKGAPVVDPQDYPTDEPVDPDDAAYGIRAWRYIYSPDGSGRYTKLPIFDFNSFTAEEQLQIPQTGDPEHPEWYVDVNGYVYQAAISMWELDETPALIGQPGTGKTELARHLAWMMGLPFVRISLTGDSEVDDLIGFMEYTPTDGTRFRLGRVVRAWTRRCVTLLDEPNTAPDAVWQRIRPMTDNSKQVALDEAGGDIFNRDPYSFVMLAYNPSWDARNIGTQELAAADRDRLDHINISLPPPEVEREIVRKRCVEGDEFNISDQDLDRIMAVAGDIRRLVNEGFPISWGIRPNIKVARKLRWFDPITAYKIAVTNDLEPQTAQTLLDSVRSHFPVN